MLDGRPYEVVGIMPPGFRFPEQDVDIWVPARYSRVEMERRDHRAWNAVGRLRPGATPGEVEAELAGVMASLGESFPDSNGGWCVSVAPAGRALREAGTLPLLLAWAVGLVLLIACVNAANILFVRSLERTRDVAIRSALGASRRRLARLVLLESLLLAACAGALGLAGSVFVVRLVDAADPGVLPGWAPLTVDWSVALFSLALATLTAIVAGALAALHVWRPGLATTLGEFGGRASGGRVDRRVRHGLVSAEVALTLVLLHGAGLLLWSLYRVAGVDPGFRDAELLTATAVLEGRGGELTTQYEGIMERLDAIPGVVAAGTVTALPLNPVGQQYNVEIFSVEYPDRTPVADRPEVDLRVASPGYHEALGVPVLEGRPLRDGDRPETPRVAVVNARLAARYFPGESAVGKHLSLGRPGTSPFEIVGVVGDVRHRGLDAEPRPEMYIPFLQLPHNDLTFAIRTLGDPAAVIPAVRAAVAEVAPGIPLVGVSTMEAVITGSLEGRRFNALVFGVVAVVAVLLASLGIYGVTSYSVSLRSREIGIRRAIGAEGGDVVADVLLGTLRIVGIGAALGVLGALVASGLLEAQLFGVEPSSPGPFAAAVGVLVLVGVVGCWAPAARAARGDPLDALRSD